MLESKWVCPKCGSDEIIEVGASRFMCQNCYHVFYSDKSKQPQQASLRKCPYCMQMKPAHLFQGGICKDCITEYRKAAKESADAVRFKRIALEQRTSLEEDCDDIQYLSGGKLGFLPGLVAKLIGQERYFEFRFHRKYRWLRILVFLVIPVLVLILQLWWVINFASKTSAPEP